MSVVKWNLRMVAAQHDIWRPTQLLEALSEAGFTPSLSKVAALWSGTPVTVRLDDLDKICAVLDCTVGDLLEPEPVAAVAQPQDVQQAVGGQQGGSRSGTRTPTPRSTSGGARRPLPPN